MNEISRRDFFAALADVSWMKNVTDYKFIAQRCGLPDPPDNMNYAQAHRFLLKAEIRWRWKYADLMTDGAEKAAD